jgi:dihydroxy-acid dehydratase
MKALLDGGFLHGDCMTVTGKTIAENLEEWSPGTPTRTWSTDVKRPITPTGGVVGLKGNLAPEGRS